MTPADVENILKLILQEQCRTVALINIISEKLGLDAAEIISKVDKLVESRWDMIEKEIKDRCDMAKQINDIFNKQDPA